MKAQRDKQQLPTSSKRQQLPPTLSSSSSSLPTSAFLLDSKQKGSGGAAARSITEQLRANHIDTLEILEKSVRDNDSLKAELARLKKRYSNNNIDDDISEKETSGDSGDRENYFLKSLEQEKIIDVFKSKVANYEMEIASLKNPAKSHNATQNYSDGNAAIIHNKKHSAIVDEKDRVIRELQEALVEERTRHDDLLESHDITATRLNNDISGLKFDSIRDKQTIQELTRANGDFKKEVDGLNSMISSMQEKNAMQRDMISQLNNKNELLEGKITNLKSGANKYEYELQSKINGLTQILEAGHDKYNQLLFKYEALIKKYEDLEASNSNSSSTLFELTTRTSSSQLDTPVVTLQGESGRMQVAPNKATSGISFEEYNATVTKLKKENKDLRVQIGDLLVGKKR